jgi:dipeptidyl aminopeptidase/acylaminoacyl peptidase
VTAADPPPLRPEHVYDLRFVGAPALSPDGERVAYVLSTPLRPEGDAPARYRHRIRLLDVASGDDRPFSEGEVDRAPRWSPDGHALAYLAPLRGEATTPGAPEQLHVIAVGGGEGRALTSFASPVLDHHWLPDGSALLVATRGEWRDADAEAGRGRVITARHHRHDGVGFIPQGPVGLWRVPLDGGEPIRLWDFVMPPGDLTLTPDGCRVVFVAPGDQAEGDEGRSRLWSRPLAGEAGEGVDLLGRAGYMSAPSVSPDGRLVAFYEPQDLDHSGSPTTLCVVPLSGDPLDGAAARSLTRDVAAAPSVAGDSRLGAMPVAPRWSDDGGALTVCLNSEGRSTLARVGLDGAITGAQWDDRVVTAFDVRGDRAAYLVESPERPGQVAIRDGDGEERLLTSWNDAFLARHAGGRFAGARTFTTADGQALTYWRSEPTVPRGDRALVLQVHGGPYTNYGYGFFFEFHLLAAAGYTVVYGNPRGGSSFGPDFAAAIKGRYGSVDADDVMAIAEHALAHHSDRNAPIHLTGGSYGGFMTNWLVGHTDRFRSAATQRSICNWLSFYGTSDIGPHFTEVEIGGNPWADVERLWRQSPLAYVDRVRTPVLVLHSEGDHRCPIEQAEQWFSALKRLGRAPTKLVRFPDECHELSRSGRPDRRVQRLEALIGWFDEHG